MHGLTHTAVTHETDNSWVPEADGTCLPHLSKSRCTPESQIPAAGEGKRTFESVPKVMRRQVRHPPRNLEHAHVSSSVVELGRLSIETSRAREHLDLDFGSSLEFG